MPKVSVLLTSYNHSKYIKKAIQSVLIQTYENFELIIGDDGSSDNTLEIIRQFNDKRIRVYSFPKNQGAVSLINKIIPELTGEYIAMHHSDDIWAPEKLEKQVKFMDANSQYAACFTQANFIDEADNNYELDEANCYKDIFTQKNRTKEEWLNYFFYNGNCLCHPSMLIRKEMYSKYKLLKVYGLVQFPDLLMWVRLCKYENIYIYPEKLIYFRLRDKSRENMSADTSATQIRMQFEYYEVLREYAQIKNKEQLLYIFPEAKKYLVNNQIDTNFALADIMMMVDKPAYKLFALDILYHLLNDSLEREKIEKLYQYSDKKFHKAAADADAFNIKKFMRYMHATVYIFYDDGTVDENVKPEVYVTQDGQFTAEFLINVKNKAIKQLRFDPDEAKFLRISIDKAVINGESVPIKPINAKYNDNGFDVFYSLDPQYNIDFSAKDNLSLKISGTLDRNKNLDVEVEEFYIHHNNEYQILLQENKELRKFRQKIIDSLPYKIYHFIKKYI